MNMGYPYNSFTEVKVGVNKCKSKDTLMVIWKSDQA
jgi:hypothetical protein